MDTLDSVLLTYACYGLNATGVPDVVTSLASIFSEKEVGDAKDMLWEQCKDNLEGKPRRVGSPKRTEKMAHLQDIVDAIGNLRGKNRMPRCMTDALGMSRWPTYNMAIVSAINQDQKYIHLEERFTQFQSEVNKKLEMIRSQEDRGSDVDLQSRTDARVRRMIQNDESISGTQGASFCLSQSGDKTPVEPMGMAKQGDGSTVETLVKTTVDLSTAGTPVKETGDVSAELRKAGAASLTDAAKVADTTKEQHEQGPPKALAGDDTDGSYSAAVLNINGGGAVSFHIPGNGTGHQYNRDHKDMEGFSQPKTRNVIRGRATNSKISGAVSKRKCSLFISNLVLDVTDSDLSDHLVGCGITGARIRRVSSREAPTKAYKVDILEQFYEKICNPDIWGEGIRIRDWSRD